MSDTGCNCVKFCGDDGDVDGPGVCKALPRAPRRPLVEIVMVPRSPASPDNPTGGEPR